MTGRGILRKTSKLTRTAPTTAAETRHCTLCNRPIPQRKPKRINGCATCKSCWRRFIGRREAAFIVDCLIFYIFIMGIRAGMDFWIRTTFFPPAFRPQVIAAALTIGLYIMFACKDGFSGYSPGKWLAGVRVLDSTTRRPAGIWASFKRNARLAIPYLSFVYMLIITAQLGRGRRLGDGWARTIVVWREHENKPPFQPDGYVCFTCGYDLRGNVSGICPECGTPIPQKRRTEAEPAPVHST